MADQHIQMNIITPHSLQWHVDLSEEILLSSAVEEIFANARRKTTRAGNIDVHANDNHLLEQA
jgi:hypothetical protein